MGELFTALSFNAVNLRRSSGSLKGAEQVRQLSGARQTPLRSRSIEYEMCGLDQASGGSERDDTKKVCLQ